MKKLYSLILFALLIINVNAQSPNWEWAKSAGGTNQDASTSVITDKNGNVIITGWFQSPTITFGTTTLINADNSGYTRDIFIAKYDASGNVLWAKSAGGMDDDKATCVATDKYGNVFMTGSFRSTNLIFGASTLTKIGAEDLFITKYNPLGNIFWAKNAGEIFSDVHANAVATDVNGNVFITGSFQYTTLTFGSTTLTCNGSLDIFVVKYNPAGTVIWAKSAGGNSFDEGSSITTDTIGNVYVTGYFESPTIVFGTTNLTNLATYSVFITKYNSLGNVVWVESAPGIFYNNDANGITTDTFGNVYITGYFQDTAMTFGTITLTNPGFQNAFLAKYDSLGNIIWARCAGGPHTNARGSAVATKSGNVFITGRNGSDSISFGATTLNALGSTGIFIVKYDTAGNELWAKSAGGASLDMGYGIALDSNENIYITGDLYSPLLTLGSTTLSNAGVSGSTWDVFLTKLSMNAGVEETKMQNDVALFPNPSSGVFSFKQNNATDIEIEIYNVLGELVYKTILTNLQVTVDLSKHPKGIYFVQITSNKKSTGNKKIIIQ
jgi:hypothetical protein